MTSLAVVTSAQMTTAAPEQPITRPTHPTSDRLAIVATILNYCGQPDPQLGAVLTAVLPDTMSQPFNKGKEATLKEPSIARKFVPTVGLKHIQFVASTSTLQRIYIVRHGESVLNVPNEQGVQLVSGQSNYAPLNAKGIKQAQKLGELLAQKIPENTELVICSSTAERAKQTASGIYEAVAKRFTTCVMGDTHPGLCELSKGKYEGQPKKTEEHAVAKWEKLSAADKYRTPIVETGESYCDTVQRSLEGLQTLAEKYAGKTLIVVAHGRIFQGFYMQWSNIIATLSSKIEPLTLFLPKNCDMLMSEVHAGDAVSNATPCAHIQFANQ